MGLPGAPGLAVFETRASTSTQGRRRFAENQLGNLHSLTRTTLPGLEPRETWGTRLVKRLQAQQDINK